MKVLFLVRHARARGAAPGQDDRERALTEGGEDDASALGRRLAALDIAPQRLLTSPAIRAASTAGLIAETTGHGPGEVEIVDALYDALSETILDVVRGLDDRTARVAVIAHNPGIGELAQALSPPIAGFPPGAVAILRIDTDRWAEVGTARVLEAWQETPDSGGWPA